jgi:transposase
VYSPENENIGITNDSRVVGIDPGIRSLVTGATHRTSETPGMSFSISNAEYKYVYII